MGLPVGYSVTNYGRMITDRARMTAYCSALRQAVRPGCVVLDIGAGTSIFSLLACQFGAGEVHAVEPDAAIAVARSMAEANGFSDRIVFHQTLSTKIALPTPADVIISDLRGILPLFEQHIPSIIDARNRLLAPRGVLIPRRDHLWAALVEAPDFYRPYVEPWLVNDFGLDLSAAQPLTVNTMRKINAKAEQLLVTPQHWATLDYFSVETPNVTAELQWSAERPGTAHGLLLWFETELADGIGFSNAPGEPELIYGQVFFPLKAPISLSQGDVIEVSILARLIENDYVWRWKTKVSSRNDPAGVKADFVQSTFFGAPLSPGALEHREAQFIPSPTQDARIDSLCLQLLNGKRTLGDIAKRVAKAFPDRFPHMYDALNHVAGLMERYSNGNDSPAFQTMDRDRRGGDPE